MHTQTMPLPRREARGFPDVHVRQGRPCPGLSHPCLRVRATCGRAGGLFGTADENRGHFTYFQGHGLPSRGSVSTPGRVAQLGPGFLTSGDTGGSCRQEPCGEARRGARPWPCSWPRRCRGGWGPPGALPVSTHSKTSANQCFWTAAHFSKIFTRQSNCFEGESFCFERTASEATRPFSPCESVSMTK